METKIHSNEHVDSELSRGEKEKEKEKKKDKEKEERLKWTGSLYQREKEAFASLSEPPWLDPVVSVLMTVNLGNAGISIRGPAMMDDALRGCGCVVLL